jgi:hypothetical protein
LERVQHQVARPFDGEITAAHACELTDLHPTALARLDGLLCPRVVPLPSGLKRRFYKRETIERYLRGRAVIDAQRDNLKRDLGAR